MNIIKKLLSTLPITILLATLSYATNADEDNILAVSSASKKSVVYPIKTKKEQHLKIGNDNINIVLPTVPTPPKVIQLSGSSVGNRTIKFSKRTPPNYVPHKFENIKNKIVSTDILIGKVNQGRISAYLRGELMEVSTIEKKLKDSGFKLLVSTPVDKKGTLVSVVFTSKDLIAMASKSNRGFMATLRVLVDVKEKRISITNPLYMAKGFLQNDFDEKVANKLLTQIIEAFPNLKNSKDSLKFQLLPKYQFINGMPHYEDMIEVASGDDLEKRLSNNKRVVFIQKLENGSILIGIKLGKRTQKFTKNIGRNNAAMLPYPILIEEGKAKILDPKYYISYMYPLLKMTEFMTIATIPDAMVKDCKRVFRKKKK